MRAIVATLLLMLLPRIAEPCSIRRPLEDGDVDDWSLVTAQPLSVIIVTVGQIADISAKLTNLDEEVALDEGTLSLLPDVTPGYRRWLWQASGAEITAAPNQRLRVTTARYTAQLPLTGSITTAPREVTHGSKRKQELAVDECLSWHPGDGGSCPRCLNYRHLRDETRFSADATATARAGDAVQLDIAYETDAQSIVATSPVRLGGRDGTLFLLAESNEPAGDERTQLCSRVRFAGYDGDDEAREWNCGETEVQAAQRSRGCESLPLTAWWPLLLALLVILRLSASAS